jgi:dihydroorotate dehydrogenase
VHPVAVRAVWECRSAFPELPILGVGGVFSGPDAVELLVAGADAVQVGTATFRDPRAPWKVLRQLSRWCDTRGTTVEGIRQSVRARVGVGVDTTVRPERSAGPGVVVPSRHEGGRDG